MNWPGRKRRSQKNNNEQKSNQYEAKKRKKLVLQCNNSTSNKHPSEGEQIHVDDEPSSSIDFFDIDLDSTIENEAFLVYSSLKQRGNCLCSTSGNSKLVLRHTMDNVLDCGKGTARSKIERDFSFLIFNNIVRCIQFVNVRDVGVVSTKEYLNEARATIDKSNDAQGDLASLLLDVVCSLLDQHRKMSVHIDEIQDVLCKFSGKNLDACIVVEKLIRFGILRKRQDANQRQVYNKAYWFALPNIDHAVKMLNDGRKEILNLISHSSFKEINRKNVENQSMRNSELGAAFHVRDLLSCGMIVTKVVGAEEVIRFGPNYIKRKRNYR